MLLRNRDKSGWNYGQSRAWSRDAMERERLLSGPTQQAVTSMPPPSAPNYPVLPTPAVPPVFMAPVIQSVTISDMTPEEGQVLTASAIVVAVPQADLTYQWQSSPDGTTWSNV